MYIRLVVFIVWSLATPAWAEPVVTAEPLDIVGSIDEGGLRGLLRVQSTERIDELTVLPGTLVQGNWTIPRARIVIDVQPLSPNIPVDIPVAIDWAPVGGTYTGHLELRWAGGSRKVPVRAIVQMTPNISHARPLNRMLVNCSGAIDCWMASLLLPESALVKTTRIPLFNQTKADVKIGDIELQAVGERTGYELGKDHFTPPKSMVLYAVEGPGDLELTFNAERIPPDRYTGEVILELAPGLRSRIPATLDVRRGPFNALLVLLLGVFFGWLFRYYNARGRPQAEALSTIDEALYLVGELPDELAPALRRRLSKARRLVVRERIDQAQALVDQVQDALTIAEEAAEIARSIDESFQRGFLRQVNSALDRDDLDAAKDAIAEELNRDAAMPDFIPESSVGGMADTAEVQIPKQPPRKKTVEAPVPTGVQGLIHRWRDPAFRAQINRYVVRPLVYTGLAVGLCLIGLEQLYVKAGTSFGAEPLSDYFTLFIWGYSADIASGTLSAFERN